MMPYQKREERIQKYEGCSKASVCNDGQYCAQDIDAWNDYNEQHCRYSPREGKYQKQELSVLAMICGAGHGDDQ